MDSNVGIGLAFIAGLASFLSPCVFSLVPAYISYLGGRSTAEQGKENRLLTLTHGVAFVLGFSAVFLTLGLGTSALGSVMYELRPWLARIGGAIVIIFGIHMTGLVRIPLLEYDLRPQSLPDRRMGYLSSALMGVFFSAGWSPCVGPVLGMILTLSYLGNISHSLLLLLGYSAGLAIPFLIAATQIGLATRVIRRYSKVTHYVEIGMGILMILIGILLISGRYAILANQSAGLFSIIDETATGMTILVVVLVLAILGLLPAAIAVRKGRNFYDWWFFGASLFPIALPMALRLKEKMGEAEGTNPGVG